MIVRMILCNDCILKHFNTVICYMIMPIPKQPSYKQRVQPLSLPPKKTRMKSYEIKGGGQEMTGRLVSGNFFNK